MIQKEDDNIPMLITIATRLKFHVFTTRNVEWSCHESTTFLVVFGLTVSLDINAQVAGDVHTMIQKTPQQ